MSVSSSFLLSFLVMYVLELMHPGVNDNNTLSRIPIKDPDKALLKMKLHTKTVAISIMEGSRLLNV